MRTIQILVKDYFDQIKKLGIISVVIISFILSSTGFVYWYVHKSPTLYQVNSSFLVDNKSSSPTTLSALASQLGLPTNLGQFPTNQFLVGFLQSNRLFKSVLLMPCKVFNQPKVHNYAEYYQVLSLKANDTIRPIRANNIQSLSLFEDSILSVIILKLNKQVIIKNSENVGSVSLSITSNDRNFSVGFANEMLRYADDYFVRYKLGQGDFAYNLSKKKIDSLHTELLSKQYTLAKIYDQSKLSIKLVDKVKANVLEQDIKVLENAYTEAANNLDLSSYAKVNQQSVLLIIDPPNSSVSIIEKKPYVYAIITFLLGSFLFIASIYGLKKLSNEA